ncbi:ABC transporter ATP-binding protein [Chitinophaga horti]|uniref:ABC transporter ATP-binding protein n=1 Tax=Chitinophaga horti TaxID=2920382 RepID=A0ABY6IVT4_9BACT|nr:ABC transporter ATP-binding protein [Chitinophaga horti]UYQ91390.1 ABC transporter ATP-binding protein [Chitinophaga horti]
MNLLQVTDIRKKEGQEEVLKGISFTQQSLQKIAIAGESGSGKSTLLKIVAGLGQASEGLVWFNGKKVKGIHEKLMPGHPGIAYLSQHYELRNNYRVEEELAYANLFYDEDSEELYRICRIDHLLKRWTTQLSGGEKQRISLARQLATSPKLLVLDEPFSNLDLVHKQTLKAVIADIGEKLSITILLVSHDPLDILSWADEIILMKDGGIVQQASPEVTYRQPASPYAAGLFGRYTILKQSIFPDTQPGLFLRPEQVAIVAEGGIPGTLQRLDFIGHTYEAEVLVNGEVIVVHIPEGGMAVGSEVRLGLKHRDYWYLG